MRTSHRTSLLALLKQFRPSMHGAEVGVHSGDTSEALLRLFPRLHLVMVDSWGNPTRSYLMSHDKIAKLTKEQHEANALQAITRTQFASSRRIVMRADSVVAASVITNRCLRFAYIDADHSKEGCAADLRAWWPKVMRGGMLCGHDYGARLDIRGHWGVKAAVDEFFDALNLPVTVMPHYVWHVMKPRSATP